MTIISLLAFPRLVSMEWAAHESLVFLESTLNQAIVKSTQGLTGTLQVNATMTQAMSLGKSEYIDNLSVGDQTIEMSLLLKF